MNEGSEAGVRLDKWLWAARFFKTRSEAADAINSGKVQLNGARAKPAKIVKTGFAIAVRKGPYEQTVIVKALLDKRVGAKIAETAYEETPQSLELRERMRIAMQSQPVFSEEQRPNKKQRRDAVRLKRGG